MYDRDLPHLRNMFRIKVVVRKEDVERARAVLGGEAIVHRLENHHDDQEDDDDDEDNDSRVAKCPECNYHQYKLGPEFHFAARGAIFLGMLGTPFLMMMHLNPFMITSAYVLVILTIFFVLIFIFRLFPIECERCGYIGQRKNFVGKPKK